MTEFGLRAAGFGGSVITDPHLLLRLMEAHDLAVYPGKYVTCISRHDRALCRRRSTSIGRTIPDQGDCKPLSCQNVAFTPEDVAEWQGEVIRFDHQLAARPRLPPVLEQRIRHRCDQVGEFIARPHRTGDPVIPRTDLPSEDWVRMVIAEVAAAREAGAGQP